MRTAVCGATPSCKASEDRSQSYLYKQGPHNICHAHPGKCCVSSVRTVLQPPALWCASWFKSSEFHSQPKRVDGRKLSWITCALSGERYDAAQQTVRCYTSLLAQWQMIVHSILLIPRAKTVSRATNLCSAAHVAHTGSPWHSWRSLFQHKTQSMQCHPQRLLRQGPTHDDDCFYYYKK